LGDYELKKGKKKGQMQDLGLGFDSEALSRHLAVFVSIRTLSFPQYGYTC
jgi:hypothetical protein